MPVSYPIFYFSILFCLAGCFLILGIDFIAYLKRSRGRGLGASAASLGAAALSFWLMRFVRIRGGYDNEHDFEYLSFNFLDYPTGLGAWFSHKEVSPLALFSAADLLSGFSLNGILWLQKSLWFLSAVLVFAALRRLGVRAWIALSSSLFLFFNFLTVLNAHTFATTHANVFYICLAVYALSGFHTSASLRKATFYLAGFMMAAFLVLSGRYEFFPPLLAGLFLMLWVRRKNFKAVWLAGIICFLSLSVLWAFFLAEGDYRGPAENFGGLGWWRNLCYHLGEQNLGILTGASPQLIAAAAVIFLFMVSAALWKKRDGAGWVWPLLLILWLLYFAVIFKVRGSYPLQMMRHHLYFFLPWVFMAGIASERFLPQRRWIPWAAGICAVFYIAANTRSVFTLQELWRTNDREWGVLLESRRAWPEGCRAYYPFHDNRGALLRKYFPYAEDKEDVEFCVLIYQPALYQIMSLPEAPAYGDRLKSMMSSPYYEAKFDHRFYTIWEQENKESLPLSLGFYYVVDSKRDNARANILFEGALTLFARGEKESALNNLKQAIQIWPHEARFYLSAASIWMSGVGQGPILEYLDRSIELALKDPLDSRDVAAEALSTRSYFWEQKGSRGRAREDLKRALEAASPEWSKRLETARHLQELK